MANLDPKQFIIAVYINDLDAIMTIDKPYLSFIIMANGIEFLGHCISNSQNWDQERVSKARFEEAVKNIPSLKKYEQYLIENHTYDLYGSLRCGLSHAAKPKHEITLSSKKEAPHLQINAGRLNLKCEDFHAEFREACIFVITQNFAAADKMNQPFIQVPDSRAVVHYTLPNQSFSSNIIVGPTNNVNSSGSAR